MGALADAIRPFWINGLHQVAGRLGSSFGEWVLLCDYQVYSPIAADHFELSVANVGPLIGSLASDCNRFASAALESVACIDDASKQVKATAWILIRLYYSSFYAANAILRILGQSTSQLETEHVNAVYRIADLFGYAPVSGIASGYYDCKYDQMNGVLVCQKATVSMGAHETFWKLFASTINRLGSDMLSSGSLVANQPVTGKLLELEENLCFAGRNAGNWLSFVRNQVTYRHAYGSWFPYPKGVTRKDVLHRVADWKCDPMQIELKAHKSDINRFIATCAFTLAMMQEMLEDVRGRCAGGRSFLEYGPQAYLNLLAAN
jgi:hypothetical protein